MSTTDTASRSANLSTLFRPRSVAIVGASDRNPWSRLVAGTLDRIGFSGDLHLINPRNSIVLGRNAVASCAEIGQPVDAAFLAVPSAAVADALRDMAKSGIRHGAIVSSGFAEAGAAGRALQEELTSLATELGISILGPNSLGYINFRDRVALSAIPLNRDPMEGGQLGIVSQSGATAAMLLRFAEKQGIGLSYAVALGNEAMVDLASVISFLVTDEQTRTIAVFAESIRDPKAFIETAELAMRHRKPIVVLKVGRGEIAARAARAHTGSLVGDDKAFDAICRKYGITRVDSMEQLILTADFLGGIGPLAGKGFAVASISGGACEMIADRGEDEGVPFAEFSDETEKALAQILPDFAATHNPLDVTGVVQANPGLFRDAITLCAHDANVDLVAAIFETPVSRESSSHTTVVGVLNALGEAMQASPVPMFLLTQTVTPVGDLGQEVLRDAGIPVVLTGLDHGARAIGAAYRWSAALAHRQEEAPVSGSTAAQPQSEQETLDYLRSAGVPVIPSAIATTADDAARIAEQVGFPVVLKIASPDIAHKTEVGGVKLGLRSRDEVVAAFEDVRASVAAHMPTALIDGVLVAPMREDGLELLVGVTTDPSWGRMIAVGLGGIWVEALADISLRPLPVSPADAHAMLDELAARKLLDGFRGIPAADREKLCDVIVGIGSAALALGDGLEALEVNPLFVRGDRIEALDGLAIWTENSVLSR